MSGDRLQTIVNRLTVRLKRNVLIEKFLSEIRGVLQSDYAILYHFYRKWQGQVTCETLSAIELSILGSTGADECFNDEYAALYEGGKAGYAFGCDRTLNLCNNQPKIWQCLPPFKIVN